MANANVWELRYDSNFRGIISDMPWEWQTTYWMNWFDGTRLADIWPEVKVQFEEVKKPFGDFPPTGTSEVLILTKKALELVKPLLRGNGEILPLRCEAEELYLFNITTVMNCLDYSGIEANYFSSGKLMWIEKYAWKPNCLDGIHIFKIPESKTSKFVSGAFKRLVEQHKLVGLRFEKA
jgi:hypothetical protein